MSNKLDEFDGDGITGDMGNHTRREEVVDLFFRMVGENLLSVSDLIVIAEYCMGEIVIYGSEEQKSLAKVLARHIGFLQNKM